MWFKSAAWDGPGCDDCFGLNAATSAGGHGEAKAYCCLSMFRSPR